MRNDTLQLLPCAKGSVTCKFAYSIQTGEKMSLHNMKLYADSTLLPRKWHYVQTTCRELLLSDSHDSDYT